jgi:uncharacterized caspase-like protein
VREVTVNGKKATLDTNGDFEATVSLKVGENKIVVVAVDTQGNRATEEFLIVREQAETVTASSGSALQGWYSKQYAIVVGIDEYVSPGIEHLENAVGDARALAAIFKRMGYEVTELYNAQATRKAILGAFRTVTSTAAENDSVIFYFAGHGQGITLVNKDKVGYIIPTDANINLSEVDVVQYDEEAIQLDTLRKYALNMRSKHIALLLDSCFSGLAMSRSRGAGPAITMNTEYYNNILNRRAVNILTAGADQPVSDGSGHSPFTQALIMALDRGNIDINDRDGMATFTELAAYVKVKVEKATNRQQRPQFDNYSIDDGDFLFRVSPQ